MFTPDGQRIMFMLTDTASGDLQVMATVALDGTDPQPATSSGPMLLASASAAHGVAGPARGLQAGEADLKARSQ